MLEQYPLLPVALHTIAIYAFLMFLLRAVGRRQMGQLTVIDLVVTILLGSAVETAMVNGNTSLQAGLVCAATLLFLNRVFALTFTRSRRMRYLAAGGAILLVHDGKLVQAHLRAAGLTEADVLEALREREQPGLEHIKFAALERNGTINVVPMTAPRHRSAPVPSRRTIQASAAPPAS